MIRFVHGELVTVNEDNVIIDVGGIGYEVSVAPPFARELEERGIGSRVKIFTYHAERGGAAGGGTPMLVGFASERDREFFEELLSVHQLGPVGACKAMVAPVPSIARAIADGDETSLKELPGVGKQRARDMISKLQEKMTPYLVGEEEAVAGRPESDELTAAALEILTQLGLSQSEALKRISAAREDRPEITEADELVRAVFRRR
ncbi:MAG: Holliday junction branch migration protein RuvA [Armatimonadota bacterium]